MIPRLRAFFNPPANGLKAPARVFWTAFLVRVLYLTLAHTYRFRLLEDHFQFGWEAGRIAQALVHGFGYADPFSNAVLTHSGPTAWLPPLYPLLVAAVFKVFGVYTYGSAWVLLTINSAISAATAMCVWEIGGRVFNRRIGMGAAWIWALYPAAMQFAVRWVWEMTLTTALFTWAFLLALRMTGQGTARQGSGIRDQGSDGLTRQWMLFGLVWGLIALSNASLLLFLPFCGLWILVHRGMRPENLRGAVLAGCVFLACVLPWTTRNWLVFHAFVPLRGNFGAEMYMGNGPDSNGFPVEYDHPHVAPNELRSYRALGEVRYVALRGQLANRYVAAHPAHFVKITLLRIYFFWASVPAPSSPKAYVEVVRVLNFGFISLCGLMGLGLAVYRRVPSACLFAGAFLLLPVPYYLVTVQARFRHPLEPLICVLGVYLFQSATPSPPSRVECSSPSNLAPRLPR